MTAAQTPYRYVTQGRSTGNLIALIVLLLGLGAARLGLDLALGWIILGLLVALPLAWDILSNRQTVLEVRPEAIAWQRPGGGADIPAPEIAHIDLKLRLDRSIKLQLQLNSGQTITAPPEAMPKAPDLEAALRAAGYDVRRHPFALL